MKMKLYPGARNFLKQYPVLEFFQTQFTAAPEIGMESMKNSENFAIQTVRTSYICRVRMVHNDLLKSVMEYVDPVMEPIVGK